VGFTKPSGSPRALVVSYTTVSPLPVRRRSGVPAVCFLWHFPAGHPGWALPTTLPCGARTFLGDALEHRRDRPADSSAVAHRLADHQPQGHCTSQRRRTDESLEIVFYLNHQDVAAMIKELASDLKSLGDFIDFEGPLGDVHH